MKIPIPLSFFFDQTKRSRLAATLVHKYIAQQQIAAYRSMKLLALSYSLPLRSPGLCGE
jgi:hypothetical protein